MAHELLCLTNDRDSRNVVLNVMLRLDTLIVSICALSFWDASLTTQPNVLVSSNLIFGKSTDDLVLFLPETVYPTLHVLHHLSLYLGVRVVEIRMESTRASNKAMLEEKSNNSQAFQDLFSDLMCIHFRVIPCLRQQVHRV